MSKKYTKKIIDVSYNERDYNITIEIVSGFEVPHSLIQVVRKAITQANFDLVTAKRTAKEKASEQQTCDLSNPGCLYPSSFLASAGNFQECHLCGASLCENCGEQKGENWFCPDCVLELVV